MRRRIAQSAVAAVAALFLFAACGGNGSGDAATSPSPDASPAATAEASPSPAPTGDYAIQEVSCSADAQTCLTVWVDETRQGPVEDAARTYMAANSGVEFNIVQKNFNDLQNDFIQQVPTGHGPDITVGANDWTGAMVQAGVVSPVTIANASDFEAVAISAFTYEGQVYGVPYSIENLALVRNTDLADTAPATWDDAIAAGQAAGKEFNVLIQVSDQGDPYTMYPLQNSFGAAVFEQNSDGSFNSTIAMGGDPGHAFAAWLSDQGTAGNLSTSITPDIAYEKFAAGDAPFIITGPWNIPNFTGMNLSIDPIPSAGGHPANPFTGIQGFFVSSQSTNSIAANDFLTSAIASEDVQVALAAAGGRPPALTAAQATAFAADTTGTMEGFAAVGKDAIPMPNIPAMASVWQFWGVTQAQIISGQQSGTPADAWDAMITNIQNAITGGS